MYNTRVVNLFGGPSTGKTTIALGLAFHLKKLRRECEYVSEVAKEFVWEDRTQTLTYQYYLHAKQFRNIDRVLGKVEFIVVDSPPVMSLAYTSDAYPEEYTDYVHKMHSMGNNLNIFLNRVVPYSEVGRMQKEAEANVKAAKILDVLILGAIPYTRMDGDADTAIPKILSLIDVH